MDKTYIDYFNFYLKQFLNEIISYFPYTKSNILLNYRQLLEDNDNKNDLYVKYFMTKVNDHLLPISKKDVSLFENKILYFVEGINFHEVWNSSDATENNKNAIWKYLQLLVLLGRRCLPNQKDIVRMLEIVGGVIETPESMDKTLEKPNNEEDEPESDEFGLGGLLKGLGSLSKLGGGDSGLNIGELGESFSAITKLASSLSEGLKDIDMEQLSKQMNESFNQVNDDDSDDESDDENDNNNADNDDNSENSDNNNQNNSKNKKVNNAGGLNSSLFTDLAEEMANTFNFDELEENQNSGEVPNIGDALGKFMQGDNPAKFMNLISKFGNRLQNDIQNGKVNQNDLLKETSQMMGNLDKMGMNSDEIQEQANKMFGENSPQAKKVRNNNRNMAARDRLRKKLAEKNKNKE